MVFLTFYTFLSMQAVQCLWVCYAQGGIWACPFYKCRTVILNICDEDFKILDNLSKFPGFPV